MKKITLTALLPVILSACHSAPHAAGVSQTTSLQEQVRLAQTQTARLQNAGAINHPAFRLTSPVAANSERISLRWDGDAVELLAQLARQRGINFVYSGTRLPLPVDVNVQNMTFENVLSMIREQTGWRARLTQDGSELRLYFSVPDRGGRVA